MIKMQKNITNFLHLAKLVDFSNQRTFWNVPSLNLDNRKVHPGSYQEFCHDLSFSESERNHNDTPDDGWLTGALWSVTC